MKKAHFVQHTVQIDKTLIAIRQAPGNSKRLPHRIYAALAETQGMMIGANKMDEAAILATASSISKQTKAIEGLISSS